MNTFSRSLITRQTKRRLERYLEENGIGSTELQKMIARGISLSQIIPSQDLIDFQKYKNIARLLQPWDINSLLPDWAVNEITKAGAKGKTWSEAQTAWLAGILGE